MPDYTTREMMDAIDQTPPVRTFLQKTFFPGEETHVTEKVEFDVRKGKRVMAPLVSPRRKSNHTPGLPHKQLHYTKNRAGKTADRR